LIVIHRNYLIFHYKIRDRTQTHEPSYRKICYIVKKGFDCFAFKQYSQEKIAEEMKNFSYLEQVEYLKKRINESDLKVWWESINNK